MYAESCYARLTGLELTTIEWLNPLPPAAAIGRHVRLIYVHAYAAASFGASSRLGGGAAFNRLSRR